MGKGTPISQELKENIADDLALGYSYGDIAERYGVSFSTIRRVKKSSEAPTAMENASENNLVDIGVKALGNFSDSLKLSFYTDTESITENPKNVKPEPDCDGQYRTEPDSGEQTEQPNNSRQLEQLDYEEQKAYIADILKATLEDIDEEIRGFEERIQTLTERLEERRQKQAYLRDFIRSM
jgi:hypothetical protein